MVSAKDASGNRLFTSDDFLSASQIAGFFSRLSATKTLHDEVEEFEDDFQSAANEARIEEFTNVAVHELQLGHPITYDVYNVCDMVARSKLNYFSVSVLKDICLFFNIDVTDISVHCKQPYMKKIQSLCLRCICQQQDSFSGLLSVFCFKYVFHWPYMLSAKSIGGIYITVRLINVRRILNTE